MRNAKGAAVAYTQLAHLPLEQALNGGIAAALFNIIYDTLLSRKRGLLCALQDLSHPSPLQDAGLLMAFPLYNTRNVLQNSDVLMDSNTKPMQAHLPNKPTEPV